MIGDIRWSLDFWLSQLSFWYGTIKSFRNVWYKVAVERENIPQTVDWDEAITLYVISDFKYAAQNSNYKAVKNKFVPKYKEYINLEKESQT